MKADEFKTTQEIRFDSDTEEDLYYEKLENKLNKELENKTSEINAIDVENDFVRVGIALETDEIKINGKYFPSDVRLVLYKKDGKRKSKIPVWSVYSARGIFERNFIYNATNKTETAIFQTFYKKMES